MNCNFSFSTCLWSKDHFEAGPNPSDFVSKMPSGQISSVASWLGLETEARCENWGLENSLTEAASAAAAAQLSSQAR